MPPVPSRRDRLRAETHAEIAALAMAQVAGGGLAGLSLSGVAREMGMSGPAIYRYFTSRDALLGRLVADAFTSLTEAVTAALSSVDERADGARFRAVARAYRAWALAHPREYVLLTTRVTAPEGRADMLAASRRALDLVVGALADVATSQARQATAPRWLMAFSVTAWQRMHGHLALELEDIHTSLGLDSAALFEEEIEAIVSDARRRARRGAPAGGRPRRGAPTPDRAPSTRTRPPAPGSPSRAGGST